MKRIALYLDVTDFPLRTLEAFCNKFGIAAEFEEFKDRTLIPITTIEETQMFKRTEFN